MKRVFALLVLLTFVPPCFGALPANELWREDLLDDVVGYAEGVTGGAGGTLCEVTSLSNSGAGTLRECLEAVGAKWVVFRVNGTINLTSVLHVKSDKTIDGRGSDITVTGNGFVIGTWTYGDQGSSCCGNIIFHNIKMDEITSNGAILMVEGAHDVWIDHLTIQDAVDEILYIGSGASGVAYAPPTDITISWNKFPRTTGNDGAGNPSETYGDKVLLVSDPSNEEDVASHFTLHHNWYDTTYVRHPLMRYATAHSFNNYYNNTEIGAQAQGDGAQFLSENDILDARYSPNYYPMVKCNFPGEEPTSVKVVNPYILTSAPYEQCSPELIFTPPYPYTLETADAALITTITSGAGWKDVVTLHDVTATLTSSTRANVSFNVANQTGSVYGCVTTSSTPPSVANHKSGSGCTKWFRETPESRINRMLQTRTLDNGSWVKRGTATVTANDTTAPDGTSTADKVEGINAGGVNDIYSLINGTYTAGTALEASFWIKRISTSGSLAVCNNNCSNGRMYVDLAALSDNWELIHDGHPAVSSAIAFVSPGAGNDGLNFHRNTGGTPPFSFHIWEPKLEAGTFPTYQPITTTTVAVTRAARTTIDPFLDNLSPATEYYLHAMGTSGAATDGPQYTVPILGPISGLVSTHQLIPCNSGDRKSQYPAGLSTCTSNPPSPGPNWQEDFSSFSTGVKTRANIEDNSELTAAGACWFTGSGDNYNAFTVVDDTTYESGKMMVLRADMNQPNYPQCDGIDWTGTSAHASKHRAELRWADGTAYERHPHGVCRWYGFVLQPRYPDTLNGTTAPNILIWQSATEDGYGPEAHLMWRDSRIMRKIKLSPTATDIAADKLVDIADQQYYNIVILLKRSTGSDGIFRVWVNANSVTDTPAYNYVGRTARSSGTGNAETITGTQLYNGVLVAGEREMGTTEQRIAETCGDSGFGIVAPRETP